VWIRETFFRKGKDLARVFKGRERRKRKKKREVVHARARSGVFPLA